MKVRSTDSLENDLKECLTNPHTSQNLTQAVSLAEQIIKFDKNSNYANYALALHELALANRSAPMVDYTKAEQVLKKIINIDPNFIEAYLMLVKIYKEVDKNEEYKILLKANKQFKDHYLIMFDLANLMTFKTGEKEKGVELYAKCVQKLPMVDSAWAALGTAYCFTRQFDMAMKSFDTALAINPENIPSILGKGVVHFENSNFAEARKYYEKALVIDKNSFWGNFNLGLLTLLEGNFLKGLEVFEKRDKDQYLEKYGGKFLPELTKDEIREGSNQEIVVLREQGLGDDVMFSRYLPLFKDLGYKVTYACSPELKDFFELSPDLDDINLTSNIPDIRHFDYRIFLMSLPWILSDKYKKKLNQPLKIDLSRLDDTSLKIPNKIQKVIKSKKLKVGISWSGSPKHMRDFCRSIDLEIFSKIFENTDVEFFVLQKVLKTKEKSFLKKYKNVHNCSDYLDNFIDTANFINKMDIIFSVDTSLVHMAGTMNKTTYLLLPKVPDYRWGLEGNQDWYPSVKALRQKDVDNWSYPLKECQNLLKKSLSSSK